MSLTFDLGLFIKNHSKTIEMFELSTLAQMEKKIRFNKLHARQHGSSESAQAATYPNHPYLH